MATNYLPDSDRGESNPSSANEKKGIHSTKSTKFSAVNKNIGARNRDQNLNDTVGTLLPFDLKKNKSISSANVFGPTLPPHLKTRDVQSIEETEKSLNKPESSTILKFTSKNIDHQRTGISLKNSITIGPSLPLHFIQKMEQYGENDDDDDVGPLPENEQKLSKSQLALEERALKLHINGLNDDNDKLPHREEWMLKLPSAKGSFGLGPRQFRQKEAPDLSDRSCWTTTPQNHEKVKEEGHTVAKVDLKISAELAEKRTRDAEQEYVAKKLKKNKESLIEMHQKKLKNQNLEERPSERRPFSREIDLQVNRFDEAKKKAVLKKAQLLDTRFSSGESKYL